MAAPLAFLNGGDINIEQGSDTTSFGYGDLFVNRTAFVGVGITVNSVNITSGNLVNFGGLGVVKDSNLGGTLTVNSTSNLQTTFVNTNLGPLSVSGGNAFNVAVGASININSTGGSVNVVSNFNTALLSGGLNTIDAVDIFATNSAGGVNIMSGQAGQLNLTAGSGGIQETTSAGNINLTANNGRGSFVVNSSTGNQNLVLSQAGITDSGIVISSAGTNVTNDAILINTTNTAGSIFITNNSNGNSSSAKISIAAGSGGFSVTTNTSGPISITAGDAPSYFIVNSTTANSNLTLGVNGNSNSSLILQSSGINQAIKIQATNTAGAILISQPVSSSAGVNINTGAGGLSVLTQTGGGINLISNGSSSFFENQTTADGQDLKICVRGNTASKLILCSNGVGVNGGIVISATGSSGGIFATAAGPVSINTSDNSNGINIGTINTVPINLGTHTSTTTVLGNLDVRGTTTTFESTVVQITDNIIQVNNAPSGLADGGIAVKRYQPANDTCTGAVVSDTPENSPGHLSQASGNSTSTITLNVADHNSSVDHYAGYWLKIISGTGSCQVRRIKSYDPITNIATIYTTIDQTGVLGNPTPVEGLDFTTIPDATSFYGLYPCQYIVSMWDELLNSWSIVCSNFVNSSTTIPIAHYVDLHINNLIANNINANTINGVVADTTTTVVLTDNSSSPVVVTGFPTTSGLYIVLVKPTTADATRCSGIFILGRLNNNTSIGTTSRILSVKGTSGEMIDMQWPANSKPSLLYRPSPGTSGSTSYSIKLITI